jgi:hypothetical protein
MAPYSYSFHPDALPLLFHLITLFHPIQYCYSTLLLHCYSALFNLIPLIGDAEPAGGP